MAKKEESKTIQINDPYLSFNFPNLNLSRQAAVLSLGSISSSYLGY